jgi:hypothetical protein
MLATVQDAPRRLTPVMLRVIPDRACARRGGCFQSGRRNRRAIKQWNRLGDPPSKTQNKTGSGGVNFGRRSGVNFRSRLTSNRFEILDSMDWDNGLNRPADIPLALCESIEFRAKREKDFDGKDVPPLVSNRETD